LCGATNGRYSGAKKKKAPIRPKPNECQDEGLKSSSEDELFWVATGDYARATIRDWMKTPKRRDRKFLKVNAGSGVRFPKRAG
jgi:hypothetical protein